MIVYTVCKYFKESVGDLSTGVHMSCLSDVVISIGHIFCYKTDSRMTTSLFKIKLLKQPKFLISQYI